jgi:hypothetical protein
LPAPRLEDVRVEDLKDTARLLDLLGQAVTRGLVSGSEADRLRFVGAAEHALAIGQGNPAGLFVYLVRGACWRYITQEDEDRANARLKLHSRPPAVAPAATIRPSLIVAAPHADPASLGERMRSDLGRDSGPAVVNPEPAEAPAADVVLVREIRQELIRRGVFREPFPELARVWGWSRERYDLALAVVTRAGPPMR